MNNLNRVIVLLLDIKEMLQSADGSKPLVEKIKALEKKVSELSKLNAKLKDKIGVKK